MQWNIQLLKSGIDSALTQSTECQKSIVKMNEWMRQLNKDSSRLRSDMYGKTDYSSYRTFTARSNVQYESQQQDLKDLQNRFSRVEATSETYSEVWETMAFQLKEMKKQQNKTEAQLHKLHLKTAVEV